MIRRLSLAKPLLNLIFLHRRLRLRLLTTSSSPPPPPPVTHPVDPDQLLRVCTVLYQQQTAPDWKLHSKLASLDFPLTHEFFLQVCNKFPSSWGAVLRFFHYTQHNNKNKNNNPSLPPFPHTSVSFNKMLDVIGKSRNIDLLWAMAHEAATRGLVNDKTFVIVLKTLASARELRKCVEFFHLMNGFGVEYSVGRLNKVVESLCKGRLVEEAKFLVLKLKEEWIKADGVTYGLLVKGFCDVGDMVEASEVWNLMLDDEGIEPGIDVFDKMIETHFKRNEYGEALKVFQALRVNRMEDLGFSTYKIVIDWLCKRGKVGDAKIVFDEMRERGIEADSTTWGSVVYGLLARGRIREAYKVVEGIQKPDISIYHGLIKGLLRLKKPREATQVFREMIKKGCEPIMHTYVMLLQGHMGKRGRKGPDPLINFDSIFVGGLVKAGKSLEATKYVERTMNRGLEVPRFDYNKFLHYYSTEEGAVMFEEAGKKLREAGMVDLADILQRYGERMATRDRRRNRPVEPS